MPIACPQGCKGTLELLVRDDPFAVAAVDVDLEPGTRQVVAFDLTRRQASRLAAAKRVHIYLFSDFAGTYAAKRRWRLR